MRLGDALAALARGEALDPADILGLRAELNRLQAGNTLFRDGEGTPAAAGTAAAGVSNYGARRDHVHSGGFVAIYDSTLSGSAANFDITDIPATYRHLRLVFNLRTDRVATSDNLLLRFAGDSGANYDWIRNYYTPGINTGESYGATSINLGLICGNSATANAFAGGELVIPDYSNTARLHNTTCFLGAKTGTSAGSFWYSHSSGSYRTTGAIARITLLPNTGPNFMTGCRVTLYGMN